MLEIGRLLSVLIDGRIVSGHLVGVDRYRLENLDGKSLNWMSYTLSSNKTAIWRRFWVTDWKRDGWILWTLSPRRKVPNKAKPVLSRSGIAKIVFIGDQGVSTPVASLSVYKLPGGRYYALERFSESGVMAFTGKKIKKPIYK